MQIDQVGPCIVSYDESQRRVRVVRQPPSELPAVEPWPTIFLVLAEMEQAATQVVKQIAEEQRHSRYRIIRGGFTWKDQAQQIELICTAEFKD